MPSPQWPEPITERLPSQIDADLNEQVQVLSREGWELCHWADVVSGSGWQHSPRWELVVDPHVTALEQVNELLVALNREQGVPPRIWQLACGIREALEGK